MNSIHDMQFMNTNTYFYLQRFLEKVLHGTENENKYLEDCLHKPHNISTIVYLVDDFLETEAKAMLKRIVIRLTAK